MKMPTPRKHLLQIIPVIVLAMTVPLASVTCGQQRKVYEPTWESLDQHQTSEWLMDAKRGLFIYAPGFTKVEWERHHEANGHRKGIARHVLDYFSDHWADRQPEAGSTVVGTQMVGPNG